MCRPNCGETDEKKVVCKSEVGEGRVGIVFGKSDSVVTSLLLVVS